MGLISTGEILMIREAVSSTALENGWDKEKEIEVFNEAVLYAVKLRAKVSKKKRHKQ